MVASPQTQPDRQLLRDHGLRVGYRILTLEVFCSVADELHRHVMVSQSLCNCTSLSELF